MQQTSSVTAATGSKGPAQGATEPGPIESLDTRGMQGPEPVLSVLKKAIGLPAGTRLEALLKEVPLQLYDLLQQRGFACEIAKGADGAFVARVSRKNPA